MVCGNKLALQEKFALRVKEVIELVDIWSKSPLEERTVKGKIVEKPKWH